MCIPSKAQKLRAGGGFPLRVYIAPLPMECRYEFLAKADLRPFIRKLAWVFIRRF
jgi:hypothetical protein